MKEAKYCEDCGDEVETRRTRCPNCGKLVCGWCYYHIHGVYAVFHEQANNACNGREAGPAEEVELFREQLSADQDELLQKASRR